MRKTKPSARGKARPKAFRPGKSWFRREAEWMTLMNLAPFGIGVVLALVFWFTR